MLTSYKIILIVDCKGSGELRHRSVLPCKKPLRARYRLAKHIKKNLRKKGEKIIT